MTAKNRDVAARWFIALIVLAMLIAIVWPGFARVIW
jgi:hypothetical protein